MTPQEHERQIFTITRRLHLAELALWALSHRWEARQYEYDDGTECWQWLAHTMVPDHPIEDDNWIVKGPWAAGPRINPTVEAAIVHRNGGDPLVMQQTLAMAKKNTSAAS